MFYRLGDFYEMFYEDAINASQLLELTLTSRNRNADEPIPMCGIPHHAAQGYIDTLIEKGYKIAICEQVEDPKTTKGMVKREVVQLITPGTVMNSKGVESKENNYLTAVVAEGEQFGLAYVDLSTGELKTAILTDEDGLINEASALQTKEMVLGSELPEDLKQTLSNRLAIIFSRQEEMEENAEFSFLTSDLTNELEVTVTKKIINVFKDNTKKKLITYSKSNRLSARPFFKNGSLFKIQLGINTIHSDWLEKRDVIVVT